MKFPCFTILSLFALSNAKSGGFVWTYDKDPFIKLHDKMEDMPEEFYKLVGKIHHGDKVTADAEDWLRNNFEAPDTTFFDFFEKEDFVLEVCDEQNRFDILMCQSHMCNGCSFEWCIKKCQKVQKDFPTCRCLHWPEVRKTYSDGEFAGRGAFGDAGNYAVKQFEMVKQGLSIDPRLARALLLPIDKQGGAKSHSGWMKQDGEEGSQFSELVTLAECKAFSQAESGSENMHGSECDGFMWSYRNHAHRFEDSWGAGTILNTKNPKHVEANCFCVSKDAVKIQEQSGEVWYHEEEDYPPENGDLYALAWYKKPEGAWK